MLDIKSHNEDATSVIMVRGDDQVSIDMYYNDHRREFFIRVDFPDQTHTIVAINGEDQENNPNRG